MMRRYKVYIPIILVGLIFFALIFFNENMVEYISQSKREQLSTAIKKSIDDTIVKKYDYTRNSEGYEYTFLEFGSTGCHACRQMEEVMEEIKAKYKWKVKVVFLNLREPENREMGDYYGIATIPTQVLLNKNGKEFFRHTGFISANELIDVLNL